MLVLPGFAEEKHMCRVHKVDVCEKEDDQLTVQLSPNSVQAFWMHNIFLVIITAVLLLLIVIIRCLVI